MTRGPWGWLPGWIFGVLAGVVVAAGGIDLARMRDLPTMPARKRTGAILSLTITVLLAGAAVWAA